VDTSLSSNGAGILGELRKRTDSPIHTIVYTHGHLDHVGGGDHFINDAKGAATLDCVIATTCHRRAAPV
jgi:glyoxylase-like metal-dependent hydrolase (beta-lactamase superfamily II)